LQQLQKETEEDEAELNVDRECDIFESIFHFELN
jgi:hypothetical protein